MISFFPGYVTSFEMKMAKQNKCCCFLNPLRLSDVSLNWRPNNSSWEVLRALQILQGTLQFPTLSICWLVQHILFLAVPGAASLELLCSGINFPLWWLHNAGLNAALSPCHSQNIPQWSWDNIRNLNIWADFFPGQLNISLLQKFGEDWTVWPRISLTVNCCRDQEWRLLSSLKMSVLCSSEEPPQVDWWETRQASDTCDVTDPISYTTAHHLALCSCSLLYKQCSCVRSKRESTHCSRIGALNSAIPGYLQILSIG